MCYSPILAKLQLLTYLPQLKVVKLLVESGANVYHKNKKGINAIEQASILAQQYPASAARLQSIGAFLSGNELRAIKGWRITEEWTNWNIASPEVGKYHKKVQEVRKSLENDMLGSGDFPFGGFIVYSKKENAETIGALLADAGCPKIVISQVLYNPDKDEWEKTDK